MPYELQQADGIREIGTLTLRRDPCASFVVIVAMYLLNRFLVCESYITHTSIEVGVLLAATPYTFIPYTFFRTLPIRTI